MNGWFLLPHRFYNRFTDRRKILFSMLAEELNCTFSPRDTFSELPKDLDFIFVTGNPHTPNEVTDVENIPSKTKLIWYVMDLHPDNTVCANLRKIFKRADKIIGPYGPVFRRKFPEFVEKYIYIPNYFAPHDRYVELLYNDSPTMKCLLTGTVNKYYPIRQKIKEEIKKNSELEKYVDINYHPHWKLDRLDCEKPPVTGDEYAKRLNSYFCCVTDSLTEEYAVDKYLEIPASGSLLLANQIRETDEIGLIPYTHFVPVTRGNVVNKIIDCLSKPWKYEYIRKQGSNYVRKNHSINNRIPVIIDIIESLF